MLKLQALKDWAEDTPAEPMLRAAWRFMLRRKYDPYDAQTMAIIRRLSPDAVCVDAGCHRGSILRPMMRQCPRGRFLGFEPVPELFDNLTKRYAADARVQLFAFALSDQNGQATFHVYDGEDVALSGLRDRSFSEKTVTGRALTVPTRRLDDIEPGLTVDFIKIDVEGAELLVLTGARETIRRSRPIVVFEHGLGGTDFYGSTPEAVFTFFDELGMAVSLLEDFLSDRAPLTSGGFIQQYYDRLNYYFVAHPVGTIAKTPHQQRGSLLAEQGAV